MKIKSSFTFGALILTVLVSACASWNQAIEISRTGSSKLVTGPDGTTHQLIQCFEIETCYNKARETCGGKYKIVDNTTVVHRDNVTSLTQLLVKCETK